MAHLLASGLGSRFENQLPATLEACNQWYVTLKYDVQSSSGTFERQSITIDRITISFDYKHSCLALEIAR